MESHVIESLEFMGHEVFGFDIKTILDLNSKCTRYIEFAARALLREPERLREKKLVSFAAEVRPDLVIVLLGNMVSPKTIALLKKVVSAPIVCWCQDALSTMGRQYMVGAPYDLVFVKDHYISSDNRNLTICDHRILTTLRRVRCSGRSEGDRPTSDSW
jgi:hypothetical protein